MFVYLFGCFVCFSKVPLCVAACSSKQATCNNHTFGSLFDLCTQDAIVANKGIVVGIPDPKNVSCCPGDMCDFCYYSLGGEPNQTKKVVDTDNALKKINPHYQRVIFCHANT